MGSLTTIPQEEGIVRSFWRRPEGKYLGIPLLAAGTGVALYEVLPYVNTIISNLWYTVTAGGALILFGLFLVTDNQPKRILLNLYKVACYHALNAAIELDPVANARIAVKKMQEKIAFLDEQIGHFRGAMTTVKTSIESNEAEAKNCLDLAGQAQKRKAQEKDALQAQQLGYDAASNASHAQRLIEMNQKDLKPFLGRLNDTYGLLVRFEQATKFTVQNKEFQIKELSIKRKAMQAGMSVLSSARMILSGSSFENQTYDYSVEVIERDASEQVGMIEDFGRTVADVVRNMDLRNGVLEERGLETLKAYESKLITVGGVDQLAPTVPAAGELVPANKPLPSSSDYTKYLK